MQSMAIDCDGCGACCSRVGYPPFHGVSSTDSSEFAALEQSHPELAAKIRHAALTDRRECGLPCLWLDPATNRCRHYDQRPEICRAFELGSPKCLELRWLKGLEIPHFNMRNEPSPQPGRTEPVCDPYNSW